MDTAPRSGPQRPSPLPPGMRKPLGLPVVALIILGALLVAWFFIGVTVWWL